MIVFGDKAFKEVIRLSEVIGWGPHPIGQASLTRRRDLRGLCAQRKILCEDTGRRRWPSQAKERGCGGSQPCRCLDLKCPASRTVGNPFLLSQLPSLRYLVIATWADKDRHGWTSVSKPPHRVPNESLSLSRPVS